MATCVVSGTLKDPSETAVSSVTVRANIITPFFVSTALIIPKEVSTSTDASGNFSLTLSQSQSYEITIDYPPDSTNSIRKAKYAIITPATGTASFSSLATEL